MFLVYISVDVVLNWSLSAECAEITRVDLLLLFDHQPVDIIDRNNTFNVCRC